MQPWIQRFLLSLIFLAVSWHAFGEDMVELTTGAKVRGRVVSHDEKEIVVEVIVGGRSFKRNYAMNKVRSVVVNGESLSLSTSSKVVVRSKKEIQDLIAREGKKLPEWYASTSLNFPPTLNLDWPQPPPKVWDNSKNIGQFIWDRINPNPSQWRNGVKFMHHIMDTKKDNRQIMRQAMLALGGMYHHLLTDYPRAAYWLQRAGVEQDPDEHPHAALQLADCYFHLGSKSMAMATLNRMKRARPTVIKLYGDMGETTIALQLAERFAKDAEPAICFLYAGDVCRVAGMLEEADGYYQKALAAATNDTRDKAHDQRTRKRAEASLAAIQFYKLNPADLADGEYTASSIGYEDEVEVSVLIRSGRIESVKVVKHREKQFYSSISDTPPRIIAKQGVRNVDAVTGATITSEAIINATAKALAAGRK